MNNHQIDPGIEQRMFGLAHALYQALETGERDKILAAQQNLSAAAEDVWAQYDQAHPASKEKAVFRLLAEMTINDLPKEIQDPANYGKIQHQMRLLKNSLSVL